MEDVGKDEEQQQFFGLEEVFCWLFEWWVSFYLVYLRVFVVKLFCIWYILGVFGGIDDALYKDIVFKELEG